MKKLLLGLFAVLMVVTMAACNTNKGNGDADTNTGSTTTPTGELSEMMTELYADIGEDNLPMLGQMEVTEENFAWVLGAEEASFEGIKEAYVSEPMMSSIAHVVLLVRTEEGATETVKTLIKEKANPRKWICVGVEDEKNVIVDNRGDVIVLIMENTHAQTIHENFKNLK